MRPGQKIAVSLVGGFVFLAVLIFVSILALLPNPAWIGKRLGSVSSDTSGIVLSDEPSANLTTAPAKNLTTGDATVDAANADSPRPSPDPSLAERRRMVSAKFIDRYIVETRIQTKVCENLGNSTAPFRSTQEFGQQIESSLLEETKPSATTEAVMLPIEYTLKNEAVRELIASMRNAADRGDRGFLQKAQFYAQAARATASMVSSRDEFTAISGHAYRLYAISRAAALKPEILQDPETNDLCRGIERSAIDGVERDIAFDQERLMRLLGRHGIDPASIDYNPETSTDFRIVYEGGSMQVKVPWLDQVFKKRQ